MDTLVLNGKTYTRASKAARNLGYTSDYVGQLCRSGNVDAHLVGRTWYVHEEELSQHRVEKKRMARVKAREQAHKSLEEFRSKNPPEIQNSYKKLAIRYEPDSGELIPKVEKKLSVIASVPKNTEIVEEDTPPYQLENEGKKVIMSGTVAVVDAEEEEKYAGFTVLTPKLVRKRKTEPKSSISADDSDDTTTDSVSTDESDEVIQGKIGTGTSENSEADVGEHMSFEERLKLAETSEVKDAEHKEDDAEDYESALENISTDPVVRLQEGNNSRGSLLWYTLSAILVAVLSGVAVCMETRITASSDTVMTSYVIEYSTVISKIPYKI